MQHRNAYRRVIRNSLIHGITGPHGCNVAILRGSLTRGFDDLLDVTDRLATPRLVSLRIDDWLPLLLEDRITSIHSS